MALALTKLRFSLPYKAARTSALALLELVYYYFVFLMNLQLLYGNIFINSIHALTWPVFGCMRGRGRGGGGLK